MFDVRSSLGMTALDLAHLAQKIDFHVAHSDMGKTAQDAMREASAEVCRIRAAVLDLARQQKA